MNTKPSKELIKAALTVCACMAVVETLKPVIEKIQQDILDKHNYRYNSEICDRREYTGFVKDIKRAYMICDADAGHFYSELHTAYINAGFVVEFGYCPLLMAESKLRDAKRTFCDLSQSLHGLDLSFDKLICTGLDNYNKYIDTTMKYVMQFA